MDMGQIATAIVERLIALLSGDGFSEANVIVRQDEEFNTSWDEDQIQVVIGSTARPHARAGHPLEYGRVRIVCFVRSLQDKPDADDVRLAGRAMPLMSRIGRELAHSYLSGALVVGMIPEDSTDPTVAPAEAEGGWSRVAREYSFAFIADQRSAQVMSDGATPDRGQAGA